MVMVLTVVSLCLIQHVLLQLMVMVFICGLVSHDGDTTISSDTDHMYNAVMFFLVEIVTHPMFVILCLVIVDDFLSVRYQDKTILNHKLTHFNVICTK